MTPFIGGHATFEGQGHQAWRRHFNMNVEAWEDHYFFTNGTQQRKQGGERKNTQKTNAHTQKHKTHTSDRCCAKTCFKALHGCFFVETDYDLCFLFTKVVKDGTQETLYQHAF